jgi:DNA (cytosine-5)-methyltransferase 1
VSIHLVNAADHGVPQRRERLFLVGFRADLAIDWRFPQATHSAEALALAQERDGPYWKRHGIAAEDRPARRVGPVERNAARNTLPWRTVRDALSGLPDPEYDPVAAARHAGHRFQPGARAYPGHTGSPLDAPAKALKAGVHGVPGGENMLRRPDGAVRYFTVRESARLQTFPDDFLFPGSWSETMRQLGNAVPVTLARIVAGAVFERLRDERETGSAAARFDQKSGNPHAASLL